MNDEQTTATQQAGEDTANQQQTTVADSTTNTTTDTQGAAATVTENAAQEGQESKQPGSIDYNFEGVQMPEGIVLNPEETARFIDTIKDMGLSNEQAGAIFKYGGELLGRTADAIFDAHARHLEECKEATLKALGADKDRVLGAADTFIRAVNIPGLREALNETGAGNMLAIVQAFAKAGEMYTEDPGKAAGTGVAQTAGNAQDVFSAMFPNTDFSKYK